MTKLANAHKRWEVPVKIIEGGSGVVRGLITEADQTQVPAYTFVSPRRIFRTGRDTALKPGVVIETLGGAKFVVGHNGDNELADGPIWRSFRLYEVTHQIVWSRRSKTVDPVTRLERDGGLQVIGTINVAIEPLDREVPDLKSRTSHEQDRFICGADVKPDDMLGDKKVIRADRTLGMILGVITR